MDLLKKYWKRVLMLFIGVILMALGGALFLVAGLGSDALMVLNQGFAVIFNLDVGYGIIIGNCFFLIIMLVLDKKSFGLGTVAIALFLGLIVNLILDIGFMQKPDTVFSQYLLLFIGIVIGGAGIALYIESNLGYSPFEGILLYIEKKTNIHFWLLKIINDAIFFVVGYFLGGTFGIGSIITIFCYGPVIDFFKFIIVKIKNKNFS